jgi:hypothetical protein
MAAAQDTTCTKIILFSVGCVIVVTRNLKITVVIVNAAAPK